MNTYFSIKLKLVYISLVISVLLTGALSIFEIQRDIRSHTELMRKELRHFETIHKAYLSAKMWSMAYDDIQQYLAGEASESWYEGIRIYDTRGKIVAQAGQPSGNGEQQTFTLTYPHNDREVTIGKVLVAGAVPNFFTVLKKRWVYTFVLNGFAVVFIFFCSYFLLYKNILTRLQSITSSLQRETPRDIGTIKLIPHTYPGNDEIDLLVRALNERTLLLSQELTKRQCAESELAQQNLQLKEEIEARRQVEKSLALQALLLSQIQDIVVATDLLGKITYVNPAYLKHVDRPENEVLGSTVAFYGENPDPTAQVEIIRETLKKGEWRGEITNTAGNGRQTVMDCRTTLVRDETGIPVSMLGISTDITARKKSEAEKELLLTAIEQSPETVVITDDQGMIQYANLAFEQLTGHSRENLAGQTPRILKSGEHDAKFYEQLWQTISSGATWKGQLTNRTRNGVLFTEEATISPVHDRSGKIVNYVAVKRDITEQLRMESHIAQSQKMETIGTLAGGIAHDFNNILFPIMGHAEILLGEIPDREAQTRNSLKQIYASALRAKELVQQILTFSRQENTEYRPLKIQIILKESLKLMRSTIPTNVEIRQSIDPTCSPINADPTQMHQVIMNLVTNAYHAMQAPAATPATTVATLAVWLEEISVDTPEKGINQDQIRPGCYVRLTVTDTGSGIPAELMGKIFDPFFTTKEKGEGTGMGLSVVHGIVKKMNGHIKVSSQVGRGTRFDVYFPVLATPDEKASQAVPALATRTGTERILLVDDEASIVDMVGQMLQRMGYTVFAKTSSHDALEAFKETPDRYDLVITDMSMPKLTGVALAQKILAIRPGTPILICTGFSENLTEEKIQGSGIRGIIMKPVLRNDLAVEIRKALDSGNQA